MTDSGIVYSDKIFSVVPLKIILDRQYGRQYLFYIGNNGAAFIRRLDAIINLEIIEDISDWRVLNYLECEKHIGRIEKINEKSVLLANTLKFARATPIICQKFLKATVKI